VPGETITIPYEVVASYGDTVNVPIALVVPADPEYAILGERGCSGDRIAGFTWYHGDDF
jgi:hypothetical protein